MSDIPAVTSTVFSKTGHITAHKIRSWFPKIVLWGKPVLEKKRVLRACQVKTKLQNRLFTCLNLSPQEYEKGSKTQVKMVISSVVFKKADKVLNPLYCQYVSAVCFMTWKSLALEQMGERKNVYLPTHRPINWFAPLDLDLGKKHLRYIYL